MAQSIDERGGKGLVERALMDRSAFPLGIFRIFLGLCLIWEMIFLMRIDFAEAFVLVPEMRFYYEGFEWVPVPPAALMRMMPIILLISSAAVCLGIFYRYAMAVTAVGMTWIFLLDKAYYNNHLYLICLLTFLLIFIPADAALSLRKGPRSKVPQWTYALLRFQLIVVYLYGGIAKMNPDWLLRQEPIRAILANKAGLFPLLKTDFAIYLVNYGGLAFDLCVGPMLLFRRTRPVAVALLLVFNLTNAWLFDDINIFPYLMLVAVVLFLNPEKVEAKLIRWTGMKDTKAIVSPNSILSKAWLFPVAIYLVWQVLFPLRGLFLPGNIDWTGRAQRFSWRMKVYQKEVKEIKFAAIDPVSKSVQNVDVRSFRLNRDQLTGIGTSPDMTVQFAHHLRDLLDIKGAPARVEVRAMVKVSMNGRPAQVMTDPEVDLGRFSLGYWHERKYVTPLKPL